MVSQSCLDFVRSLLWSSAYNNGNLLEFARSQINSFQHQQSSDKFSNHSAGFNVRQNTSSSSTFLQFIFIFDHICHFFLNSPRYGIFVSRLSSVRLGKPLESSLGIINMCRCASITICSFCSLLSLFAKKVYRFKVRTKKQTTHDTWLYEFAFKQKSSNRRR